MLLDAAAAQLNSNTHYLRIAVGGKRGVRNVCVLFQPLSLMDASCCMCTKRISRAKCQATVMTTTMPKDAVVGSNSS
jgi:hypothetical protein